jgi:uncharacterized cofD-like protein
VLQHRFQSDGDLDGHSLGNLLIAALWEETSDVVIGLEWVAKLLDARGRVLPLSTEPLEIVATVETSNGLLEQVRGQVEVATTSHQILSIELEPKNPKVCKEAVQAVLDADAVVLGPGSWFTSVLTHFQVPEMSKALHSTTATRVLVLNLKAQTGETSGYSPDRYLEVLAETHPEFRLDWVIADPQHVANEESLKAVASQLGSQVLLAKVGSQSGTSDKHDSELLASAFGQILGHDKIGSWQ